jgi:hypothetical protein
MSLATLIELGGVLHFGTLIASFCVPQVLDWQAELNKLDRLTRQLIWVHGAFIVLVILGFGVISLTLAPQLAAGTMLARGVCLFIALFWAARLAVQFFIFDARPFLTRRLWKLGYHGLTVVFLYQAVAYSLVALHG